MRIPLRAWPAAAALLFTFTGSMLVAGQEPRPEAPSQPPGGGRTGRQPVQPRVGAGADDKPGVDPELAAQGKTVYAAECITCHKFHAPPGAQRVASAPMSTRQMLLGR